MLVALAVLPAGCDGRQLGTDELQQRRGVAAIKGIAQDGFTLGRPDAPWTLSVISAATSYELDQLITQLPAVTPFVRSGRLDLQLRTPSRGPYLRTGEERAAAAALLVAGLQGRFWDAVVRFVPSYRRGLDAARVAALLRRSGVADVAGAMAQRSSHRVEAALARADEVAVTLGGKGRILYLLTREGAPAGTVARNLTGDADTGRLAEGLARELSTRP